MMSQPWRCLNECPRVGLVRGRRDRAGFPGRGDAPARTRVTRLRVGKLLARSQSRQTDCPRFSRHTRWPPGTDPSPRETQTTPATTIHSPRETQTTPAPRKTLKYAKKRHAGAVPVTPTQAPRSAGAVPVTPTRTSHHPQGPNGLSRAPPGPSAPASTGCAPRLSQPRAARSVTWAPASSTRSRGLSSTLRPRRPPEMMIVSWSRHEESMNRR